MLTCRRLEGFKANKRRELDLRDAQETERGLDVKVLATSLPVVVGNGERWGRYI